MRKYWTAVRFAFSPARYEKFMRTPQFRSLIESMHEVKFLPFRNALREVWLTADLRTKCWGILQIINHEVRRGDRIPVLWPYSLPDAAMATVPEPTGSRSRQETRSLSPAEPLEQALAYLLQPNVRTALCANVECPTPYFFPKPRQKYCTPECAKPAQREFKRSWWNKRGNAWRKRRKKKRLSTR
jgi:hypothetical protein